MQHSGLVPLELVLEGSCLILILPALLAVFCSKWSILCAKQVVNPRPQKILVLSVPSRFMSGTRLVHESDMVLVAGVSVR